MFTPYIIMRKHPLPVAASLPFLGMLALPAYLTAGTYTNDFSAGTGGLTIYTITGAAPEVRTTDGNPGAYLKLTDAVNSTTSTVLFPDLDAGYPVQAFVFEVDCRIGNGTANPADGFSISFARNGDATLDDGVGFNGGAAEEGTPTGLSIGFDTYDNGNGDVVGFSIKLDGTTLLEVPATVRNGAVDDPTSLQTGPIGSAGWARLKVELKANGELDVFWKGSPIVQKLATDWEPSGGRMVFAARTGGENEAHHFDNLTLTTTPAPLAAVTSATVNEAGYTFRITDFATNSVVTPANIEGLSIDGTAVTPTSVTKAGNVTTVTYVPATPVTNRSSHDYVLEFSDQNNLELSGAGNITSPILSAGNLLTTAAAPGYWNVREVQNGADIVPFDIGRAAALFAAATGASEETADFINFFDPNTNGGGAGLFRIDRNFLTNTDADDNNLIQGSNTVVNITGTTPAELQRSFWVQSDDGFALRIRNATFINKAGAGLIDPADSSTLAFLAGTGNSDTRGLVQFPAAGDYVVEFLWFEGGGGAFNEVAWANGDFINNPGGTAWTLVGGVNVDPILPTPLPPTPTGAAPGIWNVREFRGNYGGNLAGAISSASGDLSGFNVTDGTAPVINFNDADGGVGFDFGLFRNDLPYLGNIVGEDNDLATVARTTINFPTAGLYTIGVLVDDGWALTVPGAWFTANNGYGSLDPKTGRTLYAPGYSDNPTLGVLNVPAAGNYDVFFIAQEGGGGSGWEIFYAPGSFGSVGATNTWQLLGTPSAAPAPVALLPDSLPGPEGTAGNWGLRIIRDPDRPESPIGNSIYNALTALQTGIGVFTDTQTPYLNYADVDGGQTDFGLFQTASATTEYQTAELEYPGSTGADDRIVGIAKATLEIPAGEGGEWTFGVHSDDGYALRIDGAVFTRVTGASWIDPASTDTAFFRYGTGNSDARAVATLSEGTHDIEFIWFEGTGGSFFEVYAARGAFGADADTTTWRLIGGPNGGLPLVAAVQQDPGFVISAITPGTTAGTFNLSFASEAGITYTVQYSTDLSTWASAGTVTGTAGTTTTTVNPATLNGGTAPGRMFFRIVRP